MSVAAKDKRTYHTKRERHPERYPFRMTERDFSILMALNEYRFLRCGLIKKVCGFAENKDKQTTNDRLRKLYHAGFIGMHIPFTQVGNGSSDTIYYLEEQGAYLLQERGETLCRYHSPADVKLFFLEHTLDLISFKVSMMLAAKDHSVVLVRDYITEFELVPDTNLKGKRRSKLYEELPLPNGKESTYILPDSVFILESRKSGRQGLFLVEIDRGSQPLCTTIVNKVYRYHLYRQSGKFKRYGEQFDDFRLLIQTSSPNRVKSMRTALMPIQGQERVWIGSYKDINEKSILDLPVWTDHEGNMRQIVNVNKSPIQE